MHVLDLKKGETGRVVDYLDKELASRLLTLGLLPETKVMYIRKAPFGGAHYIKFNGHAIALRENEALSIIIEKL
jgi:ferrous iron transport protein A